MIESAKRCEVPPKDYLKAVMENAIAILGRQ
jgi:hypothetical protein